jgi:hypothetical protein
MLQGGLVGEAFRDARRRPRRRLSSSAVEKQEKAEISMFSPFNHKKEQHGTLNRIRPNQKNKISVT